MTISKEAKTFTIGSVSTLEMILQFAGNFQRCVQA
jgi:hypothetical protein